METSTFYYANRNDDGYDSNHRIFIMYSVRSRPVCPREDGVWQCVAFIEWHSVRHAIARKHDDASGAARRVEREHGLNGNEHDWHVEVSMRSFPQLERLFFPQHCV